MLLNTTSGSSLYESTVEDFKSPVESKKPIVTADAIQSDKTIENNHSELYLSAIESYVFTDIKYSYVTECLNYSYSNEDD